MEYVGLALPVVLMTTLFGLERVERWIDERPVLAPSKISPTERRLPRSAQRHDRAGHDGRRRPPLKVVTRPHTGQATARRDARHE